MEQTKFINGDIVMYGGNVRIVQEHRGYNNFDLYEPETGFTVCCVPITAIKDVKLTIEILKKNGWELKTKDVNRVNIYRHNGFRIDESVYTGDLYFVCNDIDVRLRFVSDLQHIMFAFRQNTEMEV